MEVRAVARDTGVSPRKVRRLVDMVRGKKVDEALTALKFTKTPYLPGGQSQLVRYQPQHT